MTTTRFTKEQLLKRLEEQMSSGRYALGFVQDSEILRDIEMDLRLAEIARASLTAEPIGAFHISDQQVEGTSDYIKDGEWPIDNGVIEVYTAPPAPVVPDQWPKKLTWSHHDDMSQAEIMAWNNAIDACRAAMLQGKSEPVSNRDELRDAVEIIRNSGMVFNHQKFADESQFSQESEGVNDGWVACSDRMPDSDDFVYIWPRADFGVELHIAQYGKFDRRDVGWYAQVYEHNYGIEYHPITVTHWMPLPAAPQQEAE